MAKPLYMQLSDLQDKLNRECEHHRNVREDYDRLRAELEKVTRERAEARDRIGNAESNVLGIRDAALREMNALRSLVMQLVGALRELEAAYSARVQNARHGRTLADEINLLDKARAALAAAEKLL